MTRLRARGSGLRSKREARHPTGPTPEARSLKPATLLLLCLFLGGSASAASRYDPALRFRVLVTPHFFIYFHQREDAIARRFAGVAEEVHRDLTSRLAWAPGGRTHVILVDQHDSANGWATPLPYDTIEITVAPPAQRELIGNTNDWLRLVFAHEYTHILQLDRSRGFASVFRHALGRSPLAFPNLFLPPWQVEGLATYEESATTGRGRVYGGDFRTIVTQPAREGRAFPLDRATSDLDDWPGGNTPYAYGGLFHEYLARRFGDAKLAELSARTSGRFYFVSSPAFKKVFGESLGDLWKDFLRAQGAQDERPRVRPEPRHAQGVASLSNHDGPKVSPKSPGPTVESPRVAPPGAARPPDPEPSDSWTRGPTPGPSQPGRRVTDQGFVVAGPRFMVGPHGQPAIIYSSRTADDFPALMMVDRNGRQRRIASRYSGEQASVSRGAVLFDQEDLSKSVALRSDLYRLDLSSGNVERLTAGGRFLDPAVSADGERIAAVAIRAGQRRLFVWDVPSGAWPGDVERLRRTLAGTPRLDLGDGDTEFASPRWSPDGRWLAVSRVRRDGPSEIVLVGGASGALAVLVSSAGARNVTPTWTPDGRSIVFASDRGEGQGATPGPSDPLPFNVYSVEVRLGDGGGDQGSRIGGESSPPDPRSLVPTLRDGAATPGPVRQVTQIASGASYPDVSSDGRTLAYVGYTSAGYDVFVTEMGSDPISRPTEMGSGPISAAGPKVRESEGPKVGPKVRRSEGQGSEAQDAAPTLGPSDPRTDGPADSTLGLSDPRPLDPSSYSPWRTLLPRFWMPAAALSDQQVKIGASTSGSDVLGRHLYAADVFYRVGGKAGAPGSPRYDWAAGYAYDRWLPTFFANASDRTHFLTDVEVAPGVVVPADVRDQELEAGVSVPDLHVRYEQAWTASFDVHHQTQSIGPVADATDRNALRPSWWFTSAKQYAYSIGPEQGVMLGVAGEIVRRAFGADGSADDVTIDARSYLRLFGRHAILALRAGGGASRGDFPGVRYFYLGGPGPNASPVDYGSDALNLLRGFAQNTFRGRHILVANAEYRVPLVRVEHGWGTFPVYLRTVHAAGFFDAGKTWDEDYSSRPFARSAGIELSGDFRVGYDLPITATVGLAWPGETGRAVNQPVVYFRFGHAF